MRICIRIGKKSSRDGARSLRISRCPCITRQRILTPNTKPLTDVGSDPPTPAPVGNIPWQDDPATGFHYKMFKLWNNGEGKKQNCPELARAAHPEPHPQTPGGVPRVRPCPTPGCRRRPRSSAHGWRTKQHPFCPAPNHQPNWGAAAASRVKRRR